LKEAEVAKVIKRAEANGELVKQRRKGVNQRFVDYEVIEPRASCQKRGKG